MFKIEIPQHNPVEFFTGTLHKRCEEAMGAAEKKLFGATWKQLMVHISPELNDERFNRAMTIRVGVEMHLKENGTFSSGRFWFPFEQKVEFGVIKEEDLHWVSVRVDFDGAFRQYRATGPTLLEQGLRAAWYEAFGLEHAKREMGEKPLAILTDEEIQSLLDMNNDEDGEGPVEIIAAMRGFFKPVDRGTVYMEKIDRERAGTWGVPPSSHARLAAIPQRRKSKILVEVKEEKPVDEAVAARTWWSSLNDEGRRAKGAKFLVARDEDGQARICVESEVMLAAYRAEAGA